MFRGRYRDRSEAALALVEPVRAACAGERDVLVLALPRGGVPIGFEVARAIGAELDLLVVRKLGHPLQEELAMGAIASGGITVMNATVAAHVAPWEIDEVVARERQELERRDRTYRGERPPPRIDGRCVILVDDGLATGATMRAAVQAMRSRAPARLIVAVPVAPPETIARLRREADDVVCPWTPQDFMAIGHFYVDFGQTSDEEVRQLLRRAWSGDEARVAR